MKKVLHIFPVYKTGGAPINCLRFIKGSKDIVENYAVGMHVDTVMFNDFKENTKKTFDVNLSSFSYNSLFKLIGIVYRIKPDIIHCNGKGGALYSFFLRFFLFWIPFKIFYTFRGFNTRYKGYKLKLYLYFEYVFSLIYAKGIAVSNSEKDFILKIVKMNSKKITVIPNGISVIKNEVPSKIKKEIGNFKYNIVSLSRISFQKDLETLIDAFDLLDNKDVALHIMGGYLKGDLEYRNKIELKLKASPKKDSIFMWGDVANASGILYAFDIYVSTALFEGLPTAIIEAGLNKLVVVGTDCIGNVDLISDNETGFMCKIGDSKGVASKIDYVLKNLNNQLIFDIIENNLVQMKDYNIANNRKKILELYNI